MPKGRVTLELTVPVEVNAAFDVWSYPGNRDNPSDTGCELASATIRLHGETLRLEPQIYRLMVEHIERNRAAVLDETLEALRTPF